jgi:hypothetical protein
MVAILLWKTSLFLFVYDCLFGILPFREFEQETFSYLFGCGTQNVVGSTANEAVEFG